MRLRSVLLLAAAALACRGKAAADDAAGNEPPPVVGARTALAARHPFVETVDAIGTITVAPSERAALAPPAAARVARIEVSVGERVSSGQPLVELDRTPFAAELASAQAQAAAAQAAYDRASRLADEGIAPRKDVETATAALAQARAQSVAAQRNERLATLRSPISGVVTGIGAVLGQSVDPSQSVVEVANPNALEIVLALSPALAARVHAGDSVALTAGTDAGGESLGIGVVRAVSATVDSITRSVGVRARIAHPARTLRLGESVFGRIAVAVHPGAVSVPVQALVPEGESYRVFVVDSAGIAHARDIEVGARTESEAEVTRGLAAGERVVTYGAYGVADSAKIVPVKP